jgi:hypothetical protein
MISLALRPTTPLDASDLSTTLGKSIGAHWHRAPPPEPSGFISSRNGGIAMSQSTKRDEGTDSFDLPHGRGFWVNELPYIIVLALTLGGVGYSSMVRQPLIGYWEFMAVLVAVVCVGTGWHNAPDSEKRWRLIWTQALHWGAFLVAMNLVLLPSVQSIGNTDYTSLAILLLLALGTFIAGVHIQS